MDLRDASASKKVFYGQSDPPPLRSAFCEFFWGVCLTLDYDYMCSETDFRHKRTLLSAISSIQNSSLHNLFLELRTVWEVPMKKHLWGKLRDYVGHWHSSSKL